MPLQEGKFVHLFINGTERSEYILEYERTTGLCSVGDTFSLSLQANIPIVPDPYDNILIKEFWDGSLGTVLRGYSIEINQTHDAIILVDGQDKSVLLSDYFIPAQREAAGETVDYWVANIAAQAGLSVTFGATSSAIVEEGTPMGLQTALDVILNLERLGGYFIRYSSQNDRLETFRLTTSQPTITIDDSGDELNVAERLRGTEKTRNVVKVYGGMKFNPFTEEEEIIFAKASSNIPELLVDKIVVVANPMIKKQTHAFIVANKVLNIMNTVDDIQHYTLQGFYPSLDYGEYALIDVDTLNYTFYGPKQITTLSSRADEQGVYTTVTVGEKCDRVSIQLPTPPVYACTNGDGVGVSWDGGDNFAASSYGLVGNALVCSGIAVNNYDNHMLWTADGFYRRYSSQGTWVKFMDTLPDGEEFDGYSVIGSEVKIVKLEANKASPSTFYILGVWGNRNDIARTIVYKTVDFGNTWTSNILWAYKVFHNDIGGWPTGTPSGYVGINHGSIPSDLVCGPDGTPYVILRGLVFIVGPPD